ncbi:DnaJ-class molecular chaperone with C-terminal Zn finger domain [Pleurocapsa sp. PCC 7327]|uniref:IMS domain-containing protein n=1 Tax=Pleurocapsa sp. PCC 7327 TaxID=118163 RepID=UPI00029FF93C|nr:IMS domain-containing protein [Pleurocapsa sp. PCC 7327]AFY78412.1 DnaJ-class molecular chaperone with C-terminal Zn finger domain [Pleurocapsa sp. PCC 7327]
MRIPLDYYRILGIPVRVTDELLNQAYRDRNLQLPTRWEYSGIAIAARKQLLEMAYQVLCDSQKRAEYEENFLEKEKTNSEKAEEKAPAQQNNESSVNETDESQKSVPERPAFSIEIAPEQFVGALLILQDLGEYEQVLNLGYPFLNNPQQVSPDPEDPKTLQAVKSDIILTLALAYWELGREHWQRGEYETAAELGSKGLELLEKEHLFPSVWAEIRTELYKLRPYRILELLALEEERKAERNKGLKLLKDMLQERGGIDGKGDDRSGLGIDDCLRFIQQIRIYLTAQEQQDLFEAEAQRPSTVGKYLAIYALIGRGFAEKKPALIVRAKDLLCELSERQDVYLEQAMCALLLGQTEEASRALEGSKEEEPLAFIRDRSQGEPDLLRGLCVYGERWLQTEVFSHFRDLANQTASIKQYFADKEVQEYLEQLPTSSGEQEQPSPVNPQHAIGETMAKNQAGRQQNFQERRTRTSRSALSRSRYYGETKTLAATSGGRTTAVLAANPRTYERGTVNFSGYAEEPPELSREQLVVTGYRQPTLEPPSHRRRRSSPPKKRDPERQRPSFRSPRRRNRSRSSSRRQRLLLGAAAVVFGVGAFGLVNKWFEASSSPLNALKGEQLSIALNRPPIAIPPADAQVVIPPEVLTQQGAEQVIQTWLTVKSQAMGSQHQVEKLDEILTGTLLSQWRDRVAKLKGSNNYWHYQHQMQVRSLKTDTQNPDRATVEASVREIANYYQNGQLNRGQSDDYSIRVRYELVRQQGRWLIQSSQVLR